MRKRIEISIIGLIKSTSNKRKYLLESAISKSTTKRFLTVASGVMALIAASISTAIAAKLTTNELIQYASAIVALASGAISLVATIYYSEEEIIGRLSGSSKYLVLRNSIFALGTTDATFGDEKISQFEELQRRYNDLDETYSKYFSGNDLLISSFAPEMIYDSFGVDRGNIKELLCKMQAETNEKI